MSIGNPKRSCPPYSPPSRTALYCTFSAPFKSKDAYNPAYNLYTNVVGYQAYELRDNFNFTVPTFVPVSAANLTLGDLKPDFGYGGSSIQLLDDGGACAKVEIDGLGEVDAQFYYVDADSADAAGITAGWYLVDDAGFEYCQNDRVLPVGQGYLLDCQDSGAKITYAGAVATTATEITLIDNFNFTGNLSPAPITLGDVAPDFGYGGSSIQLLDDGGACAKVEIDGLGEVDAQFYYVDAESADAAGITAGWYLVDDAGFEYCQNDRPLAAGEGFLLDCQDSGAKVELPSAL